ncbi:DegT/DnrJ/EryC1/StrS family aminotransferase [[Clostridium] symbiosum]|uniref:DegT/DnrJ/EryC1/StrS family aminotransferase n=1 Tax=Clostridium symbiosum TaxID=1512 RepID=UPI001D07C6C2|nr:DegT/DnrJ/EryC1/StrS family aminotransferase [[Clostridium] symbiosum]MCB6607635.1 DegT/DnrJ/EryC1/StrS family aminotransferase [[Clostridium] symbiosum]MCB6929312.1 DegT/DnrJ/EryC1/StrS family aminotransferase [[Clostridium] symbiosum]
MLKVPFSPPDITEQEIQEVVEALKSGWITTGPKTKEFEKQIASFVHVPRAVCLNSATACAELALHFLGIGPGDEVITSAYTYTASASIVCHAGAKLVLVDTATDSYEMDYDKLEEAITEKTKVIIPVDIGGVMCDYDRIFKIVEKKKSLFHPANEIQEKIGRVIILDDAAHAFGATRNGKACGEVADFTSFSFHAVKNLTTAEGGALTWREIPGIDNDWIYSQFMLLSLHGQNKDALAKTKLGAWEYDIVMPAYKCNMTDIMAGIGLAQLKRYPGILERRRVIVERYQERLKEIPVEFLIHDGITCDGTEHGKAKNGGSVCHEMVHDEKKPGGNEFHSSRHLCLVRLRGKDLAFRNQLIIDMAEAGVAANVHYKPLPMHTAYIKMGFDMKDYPNAYKQFENEITLPLHTCLTDEQVEYVAETFINCYRALETSLGSNTSMLEGR